MTEGEVVEQLIEFTSILLLGVSLIFSVVSAYVVALNFFIGSSNFLARLGSFVFVSVVLGMLVMVMAGVQGLHGGLIARLDELEANGELTAAGAGALANARPIVFGPITGNAYSIDSIINLLVWIGLGLIYACLGYLTFIHRWKVDVIPVSFEPRVNP